MYVLLVLLLLMPILALVPSMALAVDSGPVVGVVDSRLLSSTDQWIGPWKADWDSSKVVDVFQSQGLKAEVIGADMLKDINRLKSFKAIMVPTDHTYPDDGPKGGTIARNLLEYVRSGGIYIMAMGASHYKWVDVTTGKVGDGWGAEGPDFFGFHWQASGDHGQPGPEMIVTPAGEKAGVPKPALPVPVSSFSRDFGRADVVYVANSAGKPSVYAVGVGNGAVIHYSGGLPYSAPVRDWLIASYSAILKSGPDMRELRLAALRNAKVYAFTPVAERPESQIVMNGTWELAEAKDEMVSAPMDLSKLEWTNVSMPNPVHYALLEAGKIKNLWFGLNYKDLQWIHQRDWFLRKRFIIPSEWEGKLIRLRFDGMDYIGAVWLDGDLLGTHEGMFGGPTIDVTSKVKPGREHELLVRLIHEDYYGTNISYMSSLHSGNPKAVKSDAIDGVSYVWGNRYRSIGLWQPVRLVATGQAYMEAPYVRTDTIMKDSAKLWAQARITNIGSEFEGSVKARIIEPSGKVVWQQEIKQTVPAGPSHWEAWIDLKQPKLWWPNGMGGHPLYRLELTLANNGKTNDTISARFGVRTIELKRNPSWPKAPRSLSAVWANLEWEAEAMRHADESYRFMFVVNGKPVYAKGVSWMTSDDIAKLDPAREEWMIRSAALAGHNLFRLNGGVNLFETEQFYNLCDENGIMVWQEMPLNWCGNHSAPTAVWRDQLSQTVLRLRNHPSLALYLGGNELNPYGEDMWPVMALCREIVTANDDRPWRMSSPGGGTAHAYFPWAIWSADPTWYPKIVHEGYEFVSEWSYCTYQPMSFYRRILPKEELDSRPVGYDIKEFLSKHPVIQDRFGQLQDIDVLMHNRASWFDDLAKVDFAQYTEFCQMVHADTYGYVFEHWRAQFPYKGGQTVWMYNPMGPTAGWNIIDWFGQPLISYYSTKRAHEPVHVMANTDFTWYAPGDKFKALVWALNEKQQPLKGAKIMARVYDRKMQPVVTREWALTVPAGGYKSKATEVTYQIPANSPEGYFFLELSLTDQSGKRLSRNAYCLRVMNSLKDPEAKKTYHAGPAHEQMTKTGPWLKPQLEGTPTTLKTEILSYEPSGKEAVVTIAVKNTGAVPAYPVRVILKPESYSTLWSDNYFWLTPGESVTLTGRVRLDMAGLDPVANTLVAKPSDLTISVSAWNAAGLKLGLDTQAAFAR